MDRAATPELNPSALYEGSEALGIFEESGDLHGAAEKSTSEAEVTATDFGQERPAFEDEHDRPATTSLNAHQIILYVQEYGMFSLAERVDWVTKRLFQPVHMDKIPENGDMGSIKSHVFVLAIYAADLDTKIIVGSAILTPETYIHIIYKKYRIVFSLDGSPSMTIQCPQTGVLFYEYHSNIIKGCLHALVKPLKIEMLDVEIETEVYFSVIIQGPISAPLNAILHSVRITKDNLEQVINRFTQEMALVQNDIIQAYIENTHKIGLETRGWIQYGVTALNMLPLDSSPSLIHIHHNLPLDVFN